MEVESWWVGGRMRRAESSVRRRKTDGRKRLTDLDRGRCGWRRCHGWLAYNVVNSDSVAALSVILPIAYIHSFLY